MNLTYNELKAEVSAKLQSLQYCNSTIQKYQKVWTKFEKYLDDFQIKEFSNDDIFNFFKLNYGIDYNLTKERTRGMRQTMRALRVLIDFQQSGIIYRKTCVKNHVWPELFKKPLDAFMSLLEQSLSKSTLRQFRSHIECFIYFMEKENHTSFNELTPEVIMKFYSTRESLSKNSKAYDSYVLRKLFNFLYEHNFSIVDYSIFVPNIKCNYKSSLPSYYTSNEISVLISMIDRANATGKRDYAILLFAIKYGMRVGDIRNIKLTDFDWRNSKFSFIQSKTGNMQNFELLPEIATAIIDYYRNGRPETDCQFVFVRHIAPYCEFGKDNNLHNIISKYMNMAGFTEFHHRKRGLHSLRHSIAGNMLNQGISMSTISEILGHSSTDTTMIYTKIGIGQLSKCALEVD